MDRAEAQKALQACIADEPVSYTHLADDLADRIIGRLARQAVAAAFAVRSFDQSLLRQRAQDALKIFLRQFLPLGNLPHRDEAAAMLCQIQQNQNGIAAHG